MDDWTTKMLKGTMNPNLGIESENIILLNFDSVPDVDVVESKDGKKVT